MKIWGIKLSEFQKFGVPQLRKRIFIVGIKDQQIDMYHFEAKHKVVVDILGYNRPLVDTHFIRCLLKYYKLEELHGKTIKNKRGEEHTIHNCDMELKGEISFEQKNSS